MKKRVFTAFVLTALCVSPAFAAHPLVGDDTGTHGPGRYQLEINGETSRDKQGRDGLATRTDASQVAAIISAGFGERVDLVVGIPWQWSRERQSGLPVTTANGVGDATLELKWRFFEQQGFSLAIKPGVTLPSGDEERGFGSGRLSGGVALIATKELTPLTLHLNGSWFHNEFGRREDRRANRQDIWRTSLAALAPLARNLQLAAEVGLESNSDRTAHAWPAFAIAGVIYSLRDNLDLDLGVRHGLNEPATDLSLLAGMSLHF